MSTWLWRLLVSLGQVSFSFYLMEFVYSKEYTTTLWFNKLYLNVRLELIPNAHSLTFSLSLFLPFFLFVCLFVWYVPWAGAPSKGVRVDTLDVYIWFWLMIGPQPFPFLLRGTTSSSSFGFMAGCEPTLKVDTATQCDGVWKEWTKFS